MCGVGVGVGGQTLSVCIQANIQGALGDLTFKKEEAGRECFDKQKGGAGGHGLYFLNGGNVTKHFLFAFVFKTHSVESAGCQFTHTKRKHSMGWDELKTNHIKEQG